MSEFRSLPSHYKRCFGCGDEHPTGLHMWVETDCEEIRGTFTVTEHHQGAPGLAHGGVIASALDEAMGFVVHVEGRSRFIEVDVEHFRSGIERVGESWIRPYNP